jgi:hypothetical protein
LITPTPFSTWIRVPNGSERRRSPSRISFASYRSASIGRPRWLIGRPNPRSTG